MARTLTQRDFPMPADSLGDLLRSGNLASLTAESQRRQDLAESIRERLPAEEAAHLVAASTDDDGHLVLTMDASVWAARVRYMARELGAERIRIKVMPCGNAID